MSPQDRLNQDINKASIQAIVSAGRKLADHITQYTQ